MHLWARFYTAPTPLSSFIYFLLSPKMARKIPDARTAILQKIRSGLNAGAVAQPFPEVAHVALNSVFTPSPLQNPEVLFAAEFRKLGGVFVYCADAHQLAAEITALARQRNWQKVMCTEKELALLLDENGLQVTNPSTHIENADACITGCEALVARTGSILISSAQPYGRTATVYYPVHIVVASIKQVLMNIEDGLKFLTARGEKMPSMIHLNTGPSRTADIEKTLVVGVHGPGEVVVMLVDE